MERYGVTNVLLTSTMIRMMKEVDHTEYDLDVQVVPSCGEKVTGDIFEFVETEWDALANEIYGRMQLPRRDESPAHGREQGGFGETVSGSLRTYHRRTDR
jgi:hypothetical protein